MANKTTLLHASFVTNGPAASSDSAWQDGSTRKTPLKVTCSWSAVPQSPERQSDDFAMFFVDMNIQASSATEDEPVPGDPSDHLSEMMDIVLPSNWEVAGAPWMCRVLVVVPTRCGYTTRTKCFQERFMGCSDLGILHDRSVVGQWLTPINDQDLPGLFAGCVLLVVRPATDSQLCRDTTAVEEVYARVDFEWLLREKPKPKTLAVIDGHLNVVSYLPMYLRAVALGVTVVVLDRPDHWISDPSMRHLYADFIPIDMTPDDQFHIRIATAVKAYGHVDGLCAIATACLAPVARAAALLGLPGPDADAIALANNKYEMRRAAGGAEPTTVVADEEQLRTQVADQTFRPTFPLIVKPNTGAGSAHVCKVETETELQAAVKRTREGSGKKVLIEAYIDGPELDVNLVLLGGDLLFFEISDDFPSRGDGQTVDGDFLENSNTQPSQLPAGEYEVVRHAMHQLLLKIGLHTGVFHLEARVQNSSVTFVETDGVVDLRPTSRGPGPHQPPRCVLIEVNPRPPGFQNVVAAGATYGVNYYDLHVLASLGDDERFRSLARPFAVDRVIPQHARAWSQIVFVRVVRGGICSSDDVCGDVLEKLCPEDRALVAASACYYRRGMRVPPPAPGVPRLGGFFLVMSRRSRKDVLRVSRILQQEWCMPIAPDPDKRLEVENGLPVDAQEK